MHDPSRLLDGKKGLIAGIANANSIAYGCARACREAGAELMLTYGHGKSEPYIRPLAGDLGDPPLLLCDVRDDAQLEAVFERVRNDWGRLDFVVHSIAFAPKEDLQGRVVDCSREGCKTAMEISCWSFLRMARLAEPLMTDGGCLLTMSYYGAEKVVDHYNIMGPVKAALESAVRYWRRNWGGDQYLSHPGRQARHRTECHRSGPCPAYRGAESGHPLRCGDGHGQDPIDRRGCGLVQDG